MSSQRGFRGLTGKLQDLLLVVLGDLVRLEGVAPVVEKTEVRCNPIPSHGYSGIILLLEVMKTVLIQEAVVQVNVPPHGSSALDGECRRHMSMGPFQVVKLGGLGVTLRGNVGHGQGREAEAEEDLRKLHDGCGGRNA